MIPYYFNLTKSQMWEDDIDEKKINGNIRELSKNFFKDIEKKEQIKPNKLDINLINKIEGKL